MIVRILSEYTIFKTILFIHIASFRIEVYLLFIQLNYYRSKFFKVLFSLHIIHSFHSCLLLRVERK